MHSFSRGRGAAAARARRGVTGAGAALFLLGAAFVGAVPGAVAGPIVRAAVLAGAAVLQIPGPPAAPADLWVGAISPTQVELNWTSHSTDETGTEIWRRVATGNWIRIGEAPAGAARFVDAAVMPEIPYTYRVRAHNALFVSDWSNEAAITIPRLPPTPAGLIAGAVTATEVPLTWTGPGESGSFFTVWRKSLPGTSDFVRIALVPGTQTGYTDQTADPETRYLYRVRAETNFYRSDWSNEAAVTTPAPPPGVAVQAAVPGKAANPDTTVRLGYHLPEGDRLDRNPVFVVTDPAGALFELLPAYLTQASPDGQGLRDLHTELYPAGTYRVRAQLSLVDGSGRPGGAASPWLPLAVAPPFVASLALNPAVAAGQSLPGTVVLAGGSRNQPAVVTLTSSDPAVAAVLPASVSIWPWEVEATFTVTAGPVAAPRTVTITASYNGSSLSVPLTIVPAAGTAAARRPLGRGSMF